MATFPDTGLPGPGIATHTIHGHDAPLDMIAASAGAALRRAARRGAQLSPTQEVWPIRHRLDCSVCAAGRMQAKDSDDGHHACALDSDSASRSIQ